MGQAVKYNLSSLVSLCRHGNNDYTRGPDQNKVFKAASSVSFWNLSVFLDHILEFWHTCTHIMRKGIIIKSIFPFFLTFYLMLLTNVSRAICDRFHSSNSVCCPRIVSLMTKLKHSPTTTAGTKGLREIYWLLAQVKFKDNKKKPELVQSTNKRLLFFPK